jgi:hypothetical protein
LRRYRGRRVVFACFAPGLVFGGTEGVGSRFHVLSFRTRFWRLRGRQLHFLILRSRLIFGGVEGVRSSFHVLLSRTRFSEVPRASGPIFMFCAPYSFSTVPKASAPVFKFCTLKLVFDGTKGFGSRFHVLRCRTRFRRSGGRRVSFPCFALSDSFSAVPRAVDTVFMFCAPYLFLTVPTVPSPVFMFYAPGLIFGGTEHVGSCFHVLLFRTRFWRFRGRQLPFSYFALPTRFRRCGGRQIFFSCFALPDSFFRSSEGVGSHFHVLRPYSFSTVPKASASVFKFCTLKLVFDDTEGLGSRFHVLRCKTRFRRCGGRQVPFSCFALPNSFSAVPRASGPVFMFCALELFFDGTDGVRSRFNVLPTRTCFRRCRGRRVPFHVLHSMTRFRRYRGRRVPFSCFALPDTFLTEPRSLVPFSCFAPPDSFSAVPRASSSVFMFYAL